LFDILNCYISHSLEADIRDSFELRQLLKYFVSENDTLTTQLTTLLRTRSFWKRLVVIIRVFREANVTEKLIKFWPNYNKIHAKNCIQNVPLKIDFLKEFIDRCDKQLLLNSANINVLKGFANYELIFNNIYYILESF
jgi:hypothetical protein